LTTALLCSRVALAETSDVTIAVYAGLAEKTWQKVLAEPMAASGGVRIKVFGSALPAASVAQAEGHPDFDIALIAAYSAPGLVKRDLVQILTPDEMPAIRKVPERLWPRTPDGKLMGMPVYYSIYGIAYNTELAKPADFQSWTNLLDARWKGQVSMSRASFVAAYDVTLFAKLNGGDEQNVEPGYRFVEKLARNVLSVYTSMASLESQLGRGEVVAAPFYSNEVKSLRRSGVSNIDITIPKEGGLMLPYLLIIPKGAAHSEAAMRVLNAVVEPKYQIGFAQEAGDWPINPEVELPDALQHELGGSVQDMMARNISADWYVVGSHLEERTHRVEELIQKAQ
jgi:putative spermidine/putrescine transport system substrate-binding protein